MIEKVKLQFDLSRYTDLANDHSREFQAFKTEFQQMLTGTFDLFMNKMPTLLIECFSKTMQEPVKPY